MPVAQELYRQTAFAALRNAIVRVAEAEFKRLANGSDSREIASGIENALKSLKGLQSGIMPDYTDDWIPLFYSTWYQLSQVNLTFSMIRAMLDQRVSTNRTLSIMDKLHVIDFGCGALAMQFGVALAVADALRLGQKISSIRVDSTDSSQEMVDIGIKIWDQFREEVKGGSPKGTTLCRFETGV